jgi:hypothetical protein
VLLVLLNVEAISVSGCESLPAVAAPVAGKFSLPRMVPAPLTSRVTAGVVVLMPTFAVVPVPDWNRVELPRAPVLLVQRGRKSVVPVPDNAAEVKDCVGESALRNCYSQPQPEQPA